MQGHVLLPTTRQEIHLITCEAEDGVWGPDRGGLCSLSTLPEKGGWVGGTMAVGKERGVREQRYCKESKFRQRERALDVVVTFKFVQHLH